MRILKTTQSYYPYLSKGGLPAKVSGIAKALAGRGHDVTVLTADRDATEGRSHLREWHRKKIRGAWEYRHDGVETVYLPTFASYRAATFNPGILKFCRRRLQDYDVVHVYGLYDLLGCVVARFCRRRELPYIVEPLGMFSPKIRSKHKKHLYSRLIGTGLFRGAEVVVATSETEREELIDGGVADKRIVLRRDGLDLSEFRSLPSSGSFRKKLSIRNNQSLILFLGRLSFIKGLDVLVQAFSKIDSDAKLVIAGPDDADGCVPAVRRLIQELKLSERVILSGPLYDSEKLEAFVDADFCVLPSRYESFGISAAESVACGTPVLVTDKCGIAPLVNGLAGLVTPGNVEGVAAGISLLLSDKVHLNRLRKGCEGLAGNLSWDEPAEATERLYASLMTHHEIQALKAIEIRRAVDLANVHSRH